LNKLHISAGVKPPKKKPLSSKIEARLPQRHHEKQALIGKPCGQCGASAVPVRSIHSNIFMEKMTLLGREDDVLRCFKPLGLSKDERDLSKDERDENIRISTYC